MTLKDLLTYEGVICADCALLICNSDTSGYSGDLESYLRRVQAGREGVENVVVLDNEPFFSWFPCDLCNERLAGDRYEAAFFLEG